jgi:nicotinamide riboside transporter PnuC
MNVEVIGMAATGLAIAGCLMNNRRLRWCFAVWLISNALSLAVHVDAAIWSLAVRDAAFCLLALEGWFKWNPLKRGKRE